EIPEPRRPHAVATRVPQCERRGCPERSWIKPSIDARIRYMPVTDHIRPAAVGKTHQRAAVADVVWRAGPHGGNPGHLPAAQQVVRGGWNPRKEGTALADRQIVDPVGNQQMLDDRFLRAPVSGGV